MTGPAEGFRVATAHVNVKADTSDLTRVARIIARHLNAMADELDGGETLADASERMLPFIGEELPPDDVTPYMANLQPCPEDCQEHRLHVTGLGGIYPVTVTASTDGGAWPACPSGCDYPFPHQHTGTAIVTPALGYEWDTPTPALNRPGGALGQLGHMAAEPRSAPECPE